MVADSFPKANNIILQFSFYFDRLVLEGAGEALFYFAII
jgi:hypothetical protein